MLRPRTYADVVKVYVAAACWLLPSSHRSPMSTSTQHNPVGQKTSTASEIIWIFRAWSLLTMATQLGKALWLSTENKALPEGYDKLRKAKINFLTDATGILICLIKTWRLFAPPVVTNVRPSWDTIYDCFCRLQPVMSFRKSNEISIFELSRSNSGRERLKIFWCLSM